MDPLFLALGSLFALALVLSLVATPIARRLAIRIGLTDQPGERKIHLAPTPYGGGIAIFAVTTSLLGGIYLFAISVDLSTCLPALHEQLKGYLGGLILPGTGLKLGAILLGGAIIFTLGLIDDLRTVPPAIKIGVQGLAALLPVLAGTTATLFVESPWVGSVITVVWIVAVTNAFNLLDNMDGLSAGVAAVSGALLMVVALQGGQLFLAAFLAVFVGTLLGFLHYNFPPAKLFMGDAGSLFNGYILAVLTVVGTYYEGATSDSLYAIFTPVLILGVPLFDTASVIVIRLRTGKPIYVGDTNHFSHRLVRLGLTRREAVLTIYLLGLLLGGAATMLRRVDTAGAIFIFLAGLGTIALIVLLETVAARKSEKTPPLSEPGSATDAPSSEESPDS